MPDFSQVLNDPILRQIVDGLLVEANRHSEWIDAMVEASDRSLLAPPPAKPEDCRLWSHPVVCREARERLCIDYEALEKMVWIGAMRVFGRGALLRCTFVPNAKRERQIRRVQLEAWNRATARALAR
jgi:hypothetical protein